MLKKLLRLSTLFCLSTFAAFQYDIVTASYDNSHYEGYGGNYFHINVTGGSGTLYIVDKINNLNSMPGNNEALAQVMSDYGYIDMVTGDLVSGTGDTRNIPSPFALSPNHYSSPPSLPPAASS